MLSTVCALPDIGELPFSTSEVYDSIARATEGIPRNINNFCFNSLSLACALRKKTVNADVVEEVMADLDLQKLTWGAPSSGVNTPDTYVCPVVALRGQSRGSSARSRMLPKQLPICSRSL